MDYASILTPIGCSGLIIGVIAYLGKSINERLNNLELNFQKHLVDDAKLSGHIQELQPQLNKIGDRLDRLIEKE